MGYDAGQEFINKKICNAGETVKVYIQTLSPNNHIGKLCIGKGKITKIIRNDFNKKIL